MLRQSMIHTFNAAVRLLPLFVCICLSGCRDPHGGHERGHPHHGHSHIPPNGGTAVVLGNEQYHIEFVHAPASGKLQAYILDSHMDNFVRLTNEAFQVSARLDSGNELLDFKAVASSATGERVGDTALFEAEAAWLKTTTHFVGTIPKLAVRGLVFENVEFHFPDHHEPEHATK